MANEEHLAILEQGVANWNKWREDKSETCPDLRNTNLSGANLSMVDLEGSDLSGAELIEASFSQANLYEAIFIGADLSGADLRWANLGASNLRNAKLNWARLVSADLSGADLSRAQLVATDLSLANLSRAQMIETNIDHAYIISTNLYETDLSKAILGGTTFGNVDLSQVKGLHEVRHRSPSTIGIDSIYKSAGNIPETFLRGCGLSDMQIIMVKLHTRRLSNEQVTDLTYDIHHLIVLGAIHSHSSFISYSLNDQAFADKLYDDLQRNGVRCWFATEDMPIGGKLREEIDQAISRQEYVVLILSENSLNSGWIEDEVERAIEVEKERGQRVLLPIRLDDAVLKSDQGWARKVCRRLVGDFRNWEDEKAYKSEFDRLLRGLKATAEGGD